MCKKKGRNYVVPSPGYKPTPLQARRVLYPAHSLSLLASLSPLSSLPLLIHSLHARACLRSILLGLIPPTHELLQKRHINPCPARRRRAADGLVGKGVVVVYDSLLLALSLLQAADRDAGADVPLGAGGRVVLPADLDVAGFGLGALVADDAADDLGPVVGEGHVAHAPVDEVLVLEVGAGRPGLGAAGAGAFVRGYEDDVVQPRWCRCR